MKIRLILWLVLISVNAWGQVPVSTPEEAAKKKEINTLKKNGDAYYADMYHEIKAEDADLAEAQQRSKEMLQAHVVEIFSKRLKMSKKDVQEIWAVLEKNCQNIVVKRGDLFRVFTYVMKNALNPGEQVADATGGEVAMASVPVVPESAVPVSPAPQPAPKKDSVVAVPVVVAASPAPQSQPQPEPKPLPVQQPQPAQQPVPKPVAQPAPAPAPKPEPQSVVQPAPAPEVVVPVLCQNLIAKGNFDQVYRYLQQEKTYQRLMYGTARTMQRPEKCYIVLTDKTSGAIVAVLDKGESDRMNFMTKKMDHFRNYQGGNYKAIFVQEY